MAAVAAGGEGGGVGGALLLGRGRGVASSRTACGLPGPCKIPHGLYFEYDISHPLGV